MDRIPDSQFGDAQFKSGKGYRARSKMIANDKAERRLTYGQT